MSRKVKARIQEIDQQIAKLHERMKFAANARFFRLYSEMEGLYRERERLERLN